MNEHPRVAVALGKLGSCVHGRLDPRNPFDDEGAFATGTVSGFWTIVRGLKELGYNVDAYADVREEIEEAEQLAGARVFHIDTWEHWTKFAPYDALVSILESDLLDGAPKKSARVCVSRYIIICQAKIFYCVSGIKQSCNSKQSYISTSSILRYIETVNFVVITL